MNIKNVVIDGQQTLGNRFMLTNISPVYNYVNGSKTEEIIAHKYETVLVDRSYDKVDIKIKGEQQVALATGTTMPVEYDGLECYVYWQGDWKVGVRATKIRKKVSQQTAK